MNRRRQETHCTVNSKPGGIWLAEAWEACSSAPRVGFIVTNMTLRSRSVVRFYNKRGTAEQWIKEGKQATHWTRLSCHRFQANEVRLQLSVLAYNLGNLWRRLVLPPRIKRWSLTSLQQRLVKTGGRLVKHARYYWLLLAPAGGRTSDPAAVLRHVAADLGAAGAGRLTRGPCDAATWRPNGHTLGAVSAERPERRAFSGSHGRPR